MGLHDGLSIHDDFFTDLGGDSLRAALLITHLRSLFLIQNAASPREIVQVTDGHFERLAEQANRFRRHEVIRLIERLGEAHREMRSADSARLVLECALVKATRIDADVSLDGLLFRLEEIERKLDAGEEERDRGAGPGG